MLDGSAPPSDTPPTSCWLSRAPSRPPTAAADFARRRPARTRRGSGGQAVRSGLAASYRPRRRSDQRAQSRGSAWLLREMLANLVDNALAYTPADGRVTVRCGKTDSTRPRRRSSKSKTTDRASRRTSARASWNASIARRDQPATVADWAWRSSRKSRARHHAVLDIGSGAHDVGARVRVTFPAALRTERRQTRTRVATTFAGNPHSFVRLMQGSCPYPSDAVADSPRRSPDAPSRPQRPAPPGGPFLLVSRPYPNDRALRGISHDQFAPRATGPTCRVPQ